MSKVPYFLLNNSVDYQEIGNLLGEIYQINDALGISRVDINFFDDLTKREDFPEAIPCAHGLKLHRRAKITDMLSCQFICMDKGLLLAKNSMICW